MTTITDLLKRAFITKQTAAEIKDEFEQLQGELVEQLRKAGLTNVETPTTTGALTGTLVQVTRAVLDPDALREALTPKQWEAITVRKVDNDLLEAYVKTGQIKASTVAGCMEMVENKPFVKFTEKAAAVVVKPKKKVRR